MTTSRKGVLVLGIVLAAIAVLALFLRFIAGPGMQCWVRVVDQNGNGVEGYTCEVTEHMSSILPFLVAKARVRTFKTDAAGFFKYDSRGPVSLVFFGYWDTQWKLNPWALSERHDLGVLSAEHQVIERRDPQHHPGTRDNPYVLHVCRLGPPQVLLYWKRRVKVEHVGNYVCVDLLSGRTWESAIPEGDVAMVDGNYDENRRPPECFFTAIGGANCTLYPAIDGLGIEPPADGYTKQLCFDRDWQKKRKWTYSTIEFYYRFANPKTGTPIYGRLTLGMSRQVSNGQIEAYTNLQGARNLYYKGYTDLPYQEIKDYVSPPVQQ